MSVLGAISGATSYEPSLPPCRVGNGLHYFLGWFKVELGRLVNAFYSHYIYKAKEVGPQSTKGPFPRMQGDGFAQANPVESWIWPCGFAHHYYLGFDVV
jgi:hypothetical protein